jgi:hypothetical protein
LTYTHEELTAALYREMQPMVQAGEPRVRWHPTERGRTHPEDVHLLDHGTRERWRLAEALRRIK